MMVTTKAEAWQSWQGSYSGPRAWIAIDFDLWWKVSRLEVCAKKAAGRGQARCAAPCPFCLEKLER